MTILTPSQINLIKGIFYGQAIGDALGLGAEFLTKEQIAHYYPEGLTNYNQIVQDQHRSRWPIGSWTDDTDQFLALCDSLIESKGFDPINFAKHLYKWYNGVPMGIGSTTQRVLSVPGYTKNPSKAAELIWKMSAKKNASNGAIMRTSILGAFAFWNIDKVIDNAAQGAKVTHADPRGAIGSCVIVSYIIAYLIQQPNQLIDKQVLIDLGNLYSSEIGTYIEKAYQGSLDTLDLDNQDSMDYTLKAMACALWGYFHAKDFKSGLIEIVNQGGDADTNTCVAAAVLGTKFGYDTIHLQYIENLIDKNKLEEKMNRFINLIQSTLLKQ